MTEILIDRMILLKNKSQRIFIGHLFRNVLIGTAHQSGRCVVVSKFSNYHVRKNCGTECDNNV